jgi:hypothetical protein
MITTEEPLDKCGAASCNVENTSDTILQHQHTTKMAEEENTKIFNFTA